MKSGSKKNTFSAILLGILAIVIMGIIIWKGVFGFNMDTKTSDMYDEINAIEERIHLVDNVWEETEASYNNLMQAKVDYFAYIVNNDKTFSTYKIPKYKTILNVDNVFIISTDGVCYAKADNTKADFSRAIFNQLEACVTNKNLYAPVDVVYADGSEYRYYAAPIDRNTYAVIELNKVQLDSLTEEFSSWKNVLNNVYVGNSGMVMAITSMGYNIKYCSDESMIGKSALIYGLDPSYIYDGSVCVLNINNNDYYSAVKYIDGAYILCMVSMKEVINHTMQVVVTILATFAVVIILFMSYATILRNAGVSGKNIYTLKIWFIKIRFDLSMAKKLGAILLVGVLFILAITTYLQTVISITRCSLNNISRISSIAKNIEDIEDCVSNDLEFYDQAMNDKCRMTYALLSDIAHNVSDDTLYDIAKLVDVDSILLYDKKGVVYASNDESKGYKLSENEDDQSYAFRSLLNSNTYMVQPPMINDDGAYMQYAAKTLYDSERGIYGIMQIGKTAFEREKIMAGSNIGSILDSVITDEKCTTFAIDKTDGTIVYASDSKLEGFLAQDYGFTENSLSNDYSGYLSIEGKNCFVNCKELKNEYLFIAIPLQNYMINRNGISVFTAILSFILLMVLYLFVCRMSIHDDMELIDINDNNFENVQSAADRWRKSEIHWREQTPEQKLFTMISDFISLAALLTTIYILFESSVENGNNMVTYILNGRWEKGFNFFSFTASLLAISVGCIVNVVIKRLFTILADSLTARGTTIFRMLRSATKYIIVICVIFYIMKLFGADPKTLLTSAGVLTAIIGLGANSLTSDILAGFFLVFEGEFRVGDIVTIDGWRGVVLDIGIRTTKIEDDLHNIKIIANSQVSGIINMTKKHSYAEIFVGIDYGESLERVEAVFAKEFPLVKNNLRAITGGPYYTSVKDLGENSVVLRILAECNEKDRPQLERDLNREIKLIFDRNNINIPYPQVTVNKPIDYKKATENDKKAAQTFVDEQEIVIKDISKSSREKGNDSN